jgi:hypothetical protein
MLESSGRSGPTIARASASGRLRTVLAARDADLEGRASTERFAAEVKRECAAIRSYPSMLRHATLLAGPWHLGKRWRPPGVGKIEARNETLTRSTDEGMVAQACV